MRRTSVTLTSLRSRPRRGPTWGATRAEGVRSVSVEPVDTLSGRDRALEELYAANYVRLVRLAVLLVRDADQAEDLVQDCFVEVYRRWGSVDEAKAPAYLRQSVFNRARSALRHRSVVERADLPGPSTAPAAEATAMERARRRTVLDALQQLPDRQREVLALRHYLQLSEREIAEALGISQGAVKSHASRGAAALRGLLAEEDR